MMDAAQLAEFHMSFGESKGRPGEEGPAVRDGQALPGNILSRGETPQVRDGPDPADLHSGCCLADAEARDRTRVVASGKSRVSRARTWSDRTPSPSSSSWRTSLP